MSVSSSIVTASLGEKGTGRCADRLRVCFTFSRFTTSPLGGGLQTLFMVLPCSISGFHLKTTSEAVAMSEIQNINCLLMHKLETINSICKFL